MDLHRLHSAHLRSRVYRKRRVAWHPLCPGSGRGVIVIRAEGSRRLRLAVMDHRNWLVYSLLVCPSYGRRAEVFLQEVRRWLFWGLLYQLRI